MPTEVNIETKAIPDHDEIKLLKLSGEIDESNLGQLQTVLDPLPEDSSCQTIILELKDLNYVNSKVIGYLASFYSKLNLASKKMVFAEANPNIMDIFSLVGLTNIMEFHETTEEAINASIIS